MRARSWAHLAAGASLAAAVVGPRYTTGSVTCNVPRAAACTSYGWVCSVVPRRGGLTNCGRSAPSPPRQLRPRSAVTPWQLRRGSAAVSATRSAEPKQRGASCVERAVGAMPRVRVPPVVPPSRAPFVDALPCSGVTRGWGFMRTTRLADVKSQH
jgi:hypothetical protein